MKQLFTFLIVTVLTACATPVTTLNISGIERSNSAPVKDLRPANEKKDEIFSVLVSSEAYGLYRVGDAALAPPATRLLQHRVFEKFEQTQDITVHHLVIYRNLQSSLRGQAIGAGLGGVVGAIAGGQIRTAPDGTNSSLVNRESFDSLAKDEYKRAFYTLEENPGKGNVLIIYLDIEMSGKRVFTRTIAPFVAKEGVDPFVAAVEASIQFLIAQY